MTPLVAAQKIGEKDGIKTNRNTLFSLISCCLFAQQKTITIATLEYPPFIYSDGSKAKGPIVDKVEHIFNRLNLHADIQILPITRGLLMVKNGDVDAYFSLKKHLKENMICSLPKSR